jgi:hypothetical protein
MCGAPRGHAPCIAISGPLTDGVVRKPSIAPWSSVLTAIRSNVSAAQSLHIGSVAVPS